MAGFKKTSYWPWFLVLANEAAAGVHRDLVPIWQITARGASRRTRMPVLGLSRGQPGIWVS